MASTLNQPRSPDPRRINVLDPVLFHFYLHHGCPSRQGTPPPPSFSHACHAGTLEVAFPSRRPGCIVLCRRHNVQVPQWRPSRFVFPFSDRHSPFTHSNLIAPFISFSSLSFQPVAACLTKCASAAHLGCIQPPVSVLETL